MSDVAARRRGGIDVEVWRGGRGQVLCQHVGRHDPAAQQRRQPTPDSSLTQLGERERHVAIVPGDGSAGAKGTIERFVDQPRQFGVVGNGEGRVEVGLERKFPKQRQTERVDRADGNVGGAIAQLAPPPGGISPAAAAARSVAMMRSRISAAAFRVNVIARMLAGSTPARSRLI